MLIEEIILNYLKNKITSDVALEILPGHSDCYITLKKIDSGISNHINAATFEFLCYAPTKYESALLDDELKTALLGDEINHYGIIELPEISSCDYGGGNDGPDTTAKTYRYRSYYNFYY